MYAKILVALRKFEAVCLSRWIAASRNWVTQRFKRDIFIKYRNSIKMPYLESHWVGFWGKKCHMYNSVVFSSFWFFKFWMKILALWHWNWIKSLSNSTSSQQYLSIEPLAVIIEWLWGFLTQNLNFIFWNVNNFKTLQGISLINGLPWSSLN